MTVEATESRRNRHRLADQWSRPVDQTRLARSLAVSPPAVSDKLLSFLVLKDSLDVLDEKKKTRVLR